MSASRDNNGGHPRPVNVGSIEGSGAVFLGANNLTVGSSNLSTTFSAGVIQSGDLFGEGGPGSLTKIGTGKLVLTNTNTYSAEDQGVNQVLKCGLRP